MTEKHLILLQILFISAVTDHRQRTIPNELIIFYFVWGLLLGGEYGVWHIIPYVCRFFIPLLLLGPVFFHYHAGAGDIKLISLILAWEGILEGAELLFPGMLLSLLLISVASLGKQRNLRFIPEKTTLPMAVPIFLGATPGLIIKAMEATLPISL